MSIAINPETKVGALLEAYPEAENVLVDLAPAFAKLRNPVLRRTVAKVATLEQAAKVGGVNLKELIRVLREATGQDTRELPVPGAGQGSEADSSWLLNGRVAEEVDAHSMLEGGVHPIGKIREALAEAAPGEVVLLRSSFRPQPLIDTMLRAGIWVHSAASGGIHLTYFGRRPV